MHRYSGKLLSWRDNPAFYYGIVLSLINSAGWNLLTAPNNLDMSSIWLLGDSVQNGVMQRGGNITVYGPLGFMDWNLLLYNKLLIVSILWRVFATIFLYLCFWKIFENIKMKFEFIKAIYAIFFVSFVSTIGSPTFMIAIGLMMMTIHNITYRRHNGYFFAILVGALLGTSFLVKFFYFTLCLPSILSLLYFSSNSYLERWKNIVVSIFSCLGTIILIPLLIGFTPGSLALWARGYYEEIRGYAAMAAEEPGRLWEYPAYLVICFGILVFLWRRNWRSEIIYVLFLEYILFRYGFNRHDGHSKDAFAILTILIFILLIKKVTKLALATLIISLTSLIISSNLNFLSLINVTHNVQSFGQYLKIADPRYLQELQMSESQILINQNKINEEMLSTIGTSTVAFLPWAYTTGSAYRFKLTYPPQASLFAAYTNWLDSYNSKWVKSSESPRFILRTNPATIDRRNPYWDSPSFQIEVICNYSTVQSDSVWNLMERRDKSICGVPKYVGKLNGQSGVKVQAQGKQIIFADISQSFSTINQLQRILFKPPRADFLLINGNLTRYVPSNSKGLILAIGDKIDPIGSWQNMAQNTYQFPVKTEVILYSINVG